MRKIYRRGDSVMVTIPKPVRNLAAWAHVGHVTIEWIPPNLVIRPLSVEELMNRPRAEGEVLVEHETPDPVA